MIIYKKTNNVEGLVDWCIKTAREILGFSLNDQQIRLLEHLDNNNYTIIKSFRCAGLTTILILKVAYDIIHAKNNSEHRILFVSQDCTSAKMNLASLIKILDSCEDPIYCEKVNQFIVNLTYYGSNVTIRFSGPKLILEKKYNDLYVDNCAFLSTSYKEDCIKRELDNYRLYDRIAIGSAPDTQKGIFYDIWSLSSPKYSIFEPFAMKWYFDDRFNENLKYVKDKTLHDIKNSSILCDALQNNYEITNEWRDRMRNMLALHTQNEIDGNFLKIV